VPEGRKGGNNLSSLIREDFLHEKKGKASFATDGKKKATGSDKEGASKTTTVSSDMSGTGREQRGELCSTSKKFYHGGGLDE